MQRILLGFFIGSALAAPIGLLMGSIRKVRVIFDPYTQFFRFVPSIAWLTPVVLWFGVGETSKVLIIIYTTMFIVLINTIVGVANIAPNKLRAAACLGATPVKTFFHVTLPATLPFILTGMRLAMGNSFATVVAAEMIAADSGLGYLIFNSRLWMATDRIFIGIVCLGALGLITDPLFPLPDRALCPPIRADRTGNPSELTSDQFQRPGGAKRSAQNRAMSVREANQTSKLTARDSRKCSRAPIRAGPNDDFRVQPDRQHAQCP